MLMLMLMLWQQSQERRQTNLYIEMDGNRGG